MDDHNIRIQMPCRFWSRRLFFMIGIITSLILVFHTFTLPYWTVSLPVLPSLKKDEILSNEATSLERKRLDFFSLLSDAQNSTYPKVILKEVALADIKNASGRTVSDSIDDEQVDLVSKKEVLSANITGLMEDIDLNREISLGFEEKENLNDDGDQVSWSITEEEIDVQKNISSPGVAKEESFDFAFTSKNTTDIFSERNKGVHDEVIVPLKTATSGYNESMKEALVDNSSSHVAISSLVESEADSNLGEHRMKGRGLTNSTKLSISSSSTFDSKNVYIHIRKTKPGRLPVSVSEMKQLMQAYHSSYPQKWPSVRDKQLLAVKALMQNAPVVKNDEELFIPAFWNISKFKRSYNLMEQNLKIYVYKEGNKPVFHQPLLRGIYASEGWLMKLLQSDKHFVVRDHKKAHLFYMPFSSRLLQLAFYDPKSHSHRNLAQHLKNYIDLIGVKYPYWNRTGGADHFAAACHDWAPHITAQAMGSAIRALCNADLRRGFQLGKDVSLPEIYIRSARNPLRDLGGNSVDNRSTLAFYAGNLHGRLRPILLQHWENKDPDMKILGPMPPGVESKMIYIQHMKNSKYCICPRGYEVNSPRVVESIYYECVPVIISDNYVPPFFETLNWEAFSVIIPEEDVPRLKDLLVSIPEEKYRLMQLGVRKVQKHFLWHNRPVKYDLFHMVLHSIWYNRLNQLRIR
ncbi:probable glycosyltransferase At5g03795 [Phalaenopsis equestris]|uniref:probable glycosyltransferase At5g03795 n=1 Tax=Phalaenopsis equestris TaxID=78828 RepID=UPI0009E52F8F|nr:probable glycosyltransferase At5g03795 [Phalaenopsis equestris]